MSTTTLMKSIYINAKREKVWNYLTDKDKLATWFRRGVESLAEGEDFTLLIEAEEGSSKPLIWCTVKEWKPHSKLVTTFNVEMFNGRETIVTWTLDDAADGTRLTLVHEGVAEGAGDAASDLLSGFDKGWDKHFADLRDQAAS